MRTVVVRQSPEDGFVDTAVDILEKTDDNALRQLTYNSVCQDLDDIDREQCPKPDFMHEVRFSTVRKKNLQEKNCTFVVMVINLFARIIDVNSHHRV